ncbi:MAG: hypothetical protein EAZ76_13650 [Nostocales cyanobacterium]|nr:MAG: hypothetical protein EAZ87_23045 [Nostocales cyanobacterium]TAF12608.1 MAG: hypothetical protein EAZ76_13650 [Nostocales cyanobacterium]
MKPIHPLTSACRYCRHYQPEGRRGGLCHQFSAPVQSGWKACSLAVPAFAPSWESLEDAWSLPVAQPVISDTATINSHVENLTTALVKESVSALLVEQITEAVIA